MIKFIFIFLVLCFYVMLVGGIEFELDISVGGKFGKSKVVDFFGGGFFEYFDCLKW